MVEIELRCGCSITEDGEFVVGIGCQHCKECNTVGNMHPFGKGRIESIKFRE
jgi:hypothetical protein